MAGYQEGGKWLFSRTIALLNTNLKSCTDVTARQIDKSEFDVAVTYSHRRPRDGVHAGASPNSGHARRTDLTCDGFNAFWEIALACNPSSLTP